MIDAVAAMTSMLSDLQSLAGAAAPPLDNIVSDAVSGAETAGPTFAQTLQSALSGVDNSISQANGMAQNFSAGDQSLPLSDVMIALEKANLGLQMASGIRDKVVAAYTNVMNMQV